MYSQEIRKSLLDQIIPETLNKELESENLNPVNMPVISDIYFKEGEPLKFKSRFEVWPDFKLPDYKKIKIEMKVDSVTEKEVDQSLEELRNRAAEYVPVEGRGVVDGDLAVVELSSRDLDTKKTSPTEKVLIKAGHPENEKKLNDSLLGLKKDEERTFVIEYPNDHQNKKLAGKKIEYHLKLVAIKEKKVPELNNDFAKDIGEFKSLEELKDRIRKEIAFSKENAAKRKVAEEILERISADVNFELPETLVEQEHLALLKRRLSRIPNQDLKKEDIESIKNIDKDQAVKNVKNHLILKKISEIEGIQVSREEENSELKSIAMANNVPMERLRENLSQEGRLEEFRNNLIIKKTVDFLVKHSIIERPGSQ